VFELGLLALDGLATEDGLLDDDFCWLLGLAPLLLGLAALELLGLAPDEDGLADEAPELGLAWEGLVLFCFGYLV